MNKNTKKFVVALLSVLMVLSFMPTMAFAAANTDGSHSIELPDRYGRLRETAFSTIDSVPADTEGLKVLVEPTCTEEGAGVITCDIDLNGEPCGAERTVKIDATGHTGGDRVRLTASEIMTKMGYSASQIKTWLDANPGYDDNGFCEGYVTICKDCGKPVYQRSGSNTWRLLSSALSGWWNHVEGKIEHTAPAGTPKCAKNFTCTNTACALEKAENSDYNYTKDHKWGEAEANYKHVTTNTTDGKKYGVEVDKKVCEYCNKADYSSPKAVTSEDGTTWEAASDLDVVTDFSHPNTTRVEDPEATCMAQGAYTVKCNECGCVVDSGTIEKKAHVYETYVYDGDDGYFYKGEYCSFCLANGVETRKPGTEDERIDFAPELITTLSYKEIAPANCEQGAFVLRTFTYEYDGVTTSVDDIMSDKDVQSAMTGEFAYIIKVGDKFYDITLGNTAATRVEVPYADALGHDFGQIVKVAEATCTEAAIEAKVCSKCNKVDHATVQHVGQPLGHDITTITVKATCGTEGYSYNTCARCKLFVSKDGKTTYEADELELAKFDKVAPVVSLGTPCQFEWGDLDENTEAEICKVCGAVKPGTETPKTEEKKAKEAADAAKPVIDQAATITADTANYKASSIDAIKAAKANLDTAIYAGNADQIRKATAELQAAIDAAAKKDANTMKAKGKTVKANAKKKTTFSKAKAFKISGAKGAVTFKKKSGNKKVTVSKAGKVTVKKGLKKGKTYKIKVTVKAAGNGDYLAKSQVVTLKVKVK